MAHVAADRVKDTTTTTGTGNVTLSGTAPSTFRAFSAVAANNDTFFYAIRHQSANEWEIGLGTYVSATPAVARTSVIASSNAGAAVNLSAGTKDVWIDAPAITQTFGMLSPAQLTADQNDYNPTGFGLTNGLRFDTDNVRQLTGLGGGFDGRRVLLHCLETAQGPVILRDENTGSAAANRFILPKRRVLIWPGDTTEIWYDGVAQRWKVLSDFSEGTVINLDYAHIHEEFYTGVAGTGTATEAGETLGSYEWRSTANGTAASISPAGVADHPGIIQLVTGSTSGNDTRLHLGNAATDDIYPFSDVRYFGGLVRTLDNTSTRIKVGLGVDLGDGTVGAWGTDGVFFEFDTATNANWRTHTRAASTTTTNTTSVPVTNNEWDQLEAFRLTNGNWAFMINEAVVFTHSANLPTSAMANIGVFVETQAAAARNVQIDWISVRSARLGQRYT